MALGRLLCKFNHTSGAPGTDLVGAGQQAQGTFDIYLLARSFGRTGELARRNLRCSFVVVVREGAMFALLASSPSAS